MIVIIKDVVWEVGVLVVFVLCVLNGNGGVMVEIEQCICVVVVCLCYVLYSVVCSLIICCMYIIGVLLLDLYGEFFFELICGIDLVVCVWGLYLLVFSVYDGVEDVVVVLCVMCGWVDGMLILFLCVDLKFLYVNLFEVFFIVLFNSVVGSEYYSVFNIDNEGGVCVMVCYFVDVGYWQIVFIIGFDGNFDVVQCEYGYCIVMVEFVFGVLVCVIVGEFIEELGYCVGCELLVIGVCLQVVFVGNDMMVIGCFYVFQEVGFEVLCDIVLVGFDDILIVCYVILLLIMVCVCIVDLG